MGDIKQEYGATTAITITLNALVDDALRESTAVDNGTTKFMDAQVQVKIETHASSTPTGEKDVLIFAYGSADDGTSYSGNASGADAAYGAAEPQNEGNLKQIGRIEVVTENLIYESDLMSIASAFGGKLPEDWGIVVMNRTGFALGSTNCSAFFQGIYATG